MGALRWLIGPTLVVLTACGGQTPPDDSDAPVPPVIPPTTKVSDSATRAALTAYDPASGTMRFAQSTPALAGLQPDDVLASEPSSAAPDGYLRKVKAIRREGGGVVLETVQASLPEAISEGSLNAIGELTPADLRSSVALLPGVTVGAAEPKAGVNSQLDIGDGFKFKVSFDRTVLDVNEGPVKVKVQVSGSAYFNAGYNFGLSIRGPSLVPPRLPALTRLEAWVGFDQRSSLRIWGDANAKLSKDIKVAEQRFAPKCFSIGPVPVCVVPTLYIFVGASGEVSLSFDYSAVQTSYAKIGTKWTNRDGWKKLEPIPRYDATFDQNFVVNAGLKASVFTRAEGALMIYGVGGPTVGVKAGLELDGAVPRNPVWILSGYLEGYVSFIVDLPIFGRLSETSEVVLTFKKELGRSPNRPPILTLTGRSPDVPLGLPVGLGNGCDLLGSYFYAARDAEDGCSVAVTVTSSRDGVLPPAHTFQSSGPRTLTVVARDTNGATAQASFALNVVNTPPTVYGNLGSSAIQATVPAYFSVAALDPNTGPVDCGAITLSGFAVQTVSATGGDCRYSVTFPQPGTQTLLATARDPQGTPSEPKSFTVQVGPAPVVPPPVWQIPPGLEVRDTANRLIPSEAEVEVACAFTVRLSARATDPGGRTVTYVWQEFFPNGTSRTLTPAADGTLTTGVGREYTGRVRYQVTASNGASSNNPLSQYVRYMAGVCVK